MRSTDSPYPAAWYGTDLSNVGLGEVRPDVGTYGAYSYSDLPTLPLDLRGGFEWLEHEAAHSEHIGREKAAELPAAVDALRTACNALGLWLPRSFELFVRAPALWARVRSCTDCFLDIGPAPIRAPDGTGYLIRFLKDSQGCLFWYLYLVGDGTMHGVLVSSDFHGTAAEQGHDEPPAAADLVFCAESFEEFMARFWLENELWLAGYNGQAVSVAGAEYVARYQQTGGSAA